MGRGDGFVIQNLICLDKESYIFIEYIGRYFEYAMEHILGKVLHLYYII